MGGVKRFLQNVRRWGTAADGDAVLYDSALQRFEPGPVAGGSAVTIGDTQVAYATAADTLGGDAGLTYDGTSNLLTAASARFSAVLPQTVSIGSYFDGEYHTPLLIATEVTDPTLSGVAVTALATILNIDLTDDDAENTTWVGHGAYVSTDGLTDIGAVIGLQSLVDIPFDADGRTNYAVALDLLVDVAASSGGAAAINGVFIGTSAGGDGTTTSAMTGLEVKQIVRADVTVTNAYGLKVNTPTNAGTITNAYGLFLQNQTVAGSTLNYAIDVNGLFRVSPTGLNVSLGNGGALQTTTTTAHTALFQAYDVDGAAYRTFLTLLNGNVPRCTIEQPAGGLLVFIPPTSDPGVAGALWNNAGTLAISV